MNSLSDLRTTLDEHAEHVLDGEAVVRSAAVRHRVAVVRRRRRVTVAGAACAVLLAGAAGLVVPRVDGDSLPAAPTVLGVKAPTNQHSLGYTYRTDGSSETFAGSDSMDIESSSQPRLLSWTTERHTTVRITLPDATHWTSRLSRFRDFVVIPPQVSGKLRVSVDAGRVGLTTYDLTDAQPDGVTRDGITFRRAVAGSPLLTAAIGAQGQNDVRTSYLGIRGPVRVSVLCTGAPSDSTVHVSMGRAESSTGCDGTTFDPGADVIGSNTPGRIGRAVPVRVWVTGPDGTTPLTSDDVRIGVGLYGPFGRARTDIGPMDIDLEYGGHTWRLDTVQHPPTPFIDLQPLAQATLIRVAMATHGDKPAGLTIRVTGLPLEQSGFGGDGVGISGPYWVPAGAHAQVRRSPAGALVVARYARAD